MRYPRGQVIALLSVATFTGIFFSSRSLLAQDSPGPSQTQGEMILEKPVKLKTDTLLDDGATIDLHTDNTILRDVTIKRKGDSGQVSLGPLSIWIGANISYDLYEINEIYNYGNGGGTDVGQKTRHLEGTLRSRLRDWGEIKAQYDVEAGNWTDLYLRWVSRLTPRPYTITVGNQKEPMGLAWLGGGTSETAQELAAPSKAFGDWRSFGVRVHRAFNLGAADRAFGFWKGDDAAVTTSLGVFTEDINSSNGTSVAVTGRATAGRRKGYSSTHLGFSGSLRQAKGNYDKVSFRPEIYEADKIVLARPDADTLAVGALEAAHGHGALQLQAEAYLANYAGNVDGYGTGGYVQVGWVVVGQGRSYQTDWGVLAPIRPVGNTHVIEVFSRFSHTRGEDDVNGWNAYNSLTLGANVYFRKITCSVNALYGRTRDRIEGEDDGFGVVARARFLF